MTRHFGLKYPPDWQPEEARLADLRDPNIGWVWFRFCLLVGGVLSFLSFCFFYLLRGMAV